MKNKMFENKIKPILLYIGSIGASIMCIAYIIAVFVLINGFKVEQMLQTGIFGVVNAAVGFIIMQFLKIQGFAFAKENNKELVTKYYGTKTKDKKCHSMKFYWSTSIVKDILIKCLAVGATSVGLVYIVIQGSNDYNLLLLALVNLLLFICFGFIALVKAYDFFNESFVPYMKEKLNDVGESYKEVCEGSVDMEKTVDICETEHSLDINSGSDILDRHSDISSDGSTDKSLVLDSTGSSVCDTSNSIAGNTNTDWFSDWNKKYK